MEPIYNRIGAGYDATRRADPYIAGKLDSYLSTKDGLSYLDVACGTGNYTVAWIPAKVGMTIYEPLGVLS